jgi:hypothetical protein
MKRSHKIVAGLAAATSLMITAAVYAHPAHMGEGGMGMGMRQGMMQGGMGMGQGMQGHGMGAGAEHAGMMGQGAAQQLMTPEERSAMQEKMRSAKTPEERQKIAQANRAEMEKRAKEKGITLPEQRGPRAGNGPQSGPHQH